jgi:hypothetical protein
MGGAYVAVAEGGNAAFWNPAAMAVTEGPTLACNDYQEYAPGSDQYASGNGAAALSVPFTLRGLPWYREPLDVAVGATGVYYRMDDIEYRPTRDRRYSGAIEWWTWGASLSAASRLPVPWDGGDICLGVTWSSAAEKFASDNTPSPFTGEMVRALKGWGVSCLVRTTTGRVTLGVDVRNPGGGFTWADQHEDAIPRTAAFGLSYRPVGVLLPFRRFAKTMLTVEERVESVGGGGTNRWSHHGGFQMRLWDHVDFRGGIQLESFRQEQSGYDERMIQWSVGFGFRAPLGWGSSLLLDWALVEHPYWGYRHIMSLEMML